MQERSSVICTPKNLVLFNLSKQHYWCSLGSFVNVLSWSCWQSLWVFSTLGKRTTNHLPVVGFLIVTSDGANQAHHRPPKWCTQSWGSSVKSSGLSRHPSGALVLSVMVRFLPTLTFCVLPVRKYWAQLHREVLSTKWPGFCLCSWGMIVLNAVINAIRCEVSGPKVYLRHFGVWRSLEDCDNGYLVSVVDCNCELRAPADMHWVHRG